MSFALSLYLAPVYTLHARQVLDEVSPAGPNILQQESIYADGVLYAQQLARKAEALAVEQGWGYRGNEDCCAGAGGQLERHCAQHWKVCNGEQGVWRAHHLCVFLVCTHTGLMEHHCAAEHKRMIIQKGWAGRGGGLRVCM